MMKKRNIGLILSSLLVFTALIFSSVINNDYKRTNADELVGTPEIAWNNVDYSYQSGPSWSPDTTDNGIPLSGYCFLAMYPQNISQVIRCAENLLDSSLEGCSVKDHILINGIESQNVEDVIIYCYPENGLFIYIPHESITFTEEYEYATVEILEGMSIDGSAQTVSTRFEYRGILGTHGNWLVNPAPEERVKGEFHSIAWNNRDYSFLTNEEWSGELFPNLAPVNGYALLAFFNEEGKTLDDSEIGSPYTIGRGVIGQGLNVDYKVKINGINIVDVEDAICYIYPKYGLFFYVPHNSLTFNDTYEVPTITVEDGMRLNHFIFPYISFEFQSEIGETDGWIYKKEPSSYETIPFKGVAEKWNNVPLDNTHTQSILQFGEYGVDYLKKDGVSSATNLVNKYSDCGKKILVNGLPLWQYEDTVASYYHGYCYVYLVLPLSALTPSNGYKVVSLHIEEGTMFYDVLLPEVNLYLFNGIWTTTRPTTPEDSDYDNAYSLSSVFNTEKTTLDENSKELPGTKESNINSFALFFDYKIVNPDSAFVLFALGKKNQAGLRLVFKNNAISLYDATQNNVLLGELSLENFVYDEWYSLLLYTKVVDNKLSINLAIDDITYIETNNVTLVNMENIGNLYSVTLGSGTVSLKNAQLGEDNKKPVLSYDGKSVYSVLSNSDILDFTIRCSAYDTKDGDVTHLIEYRWPEGSITDNKINKGIWEVEIIAKDKSNNISKIIVTIIACDKLEVTVTFDGFNPTIYKVGDCISPVQDPIKEDDEYNTYRFIGWYYNDRLWDFENDYIINDMNLTSRFISSNKEYVVSFNVEGLNNVKSYSLYFAYGTEVNINMFNREGYSLKAYLNDEEIDKFVVNQDMNIKLIYSLDNSNNSNKKCGGDITSTSIILSSISLFGILLFSLLKKGGKEHE